jgi:flagellar hook assembly protein FlgD/outer membrane protein OmpA-like peptidoglycan-associated protein
MKNTSIIAGFLFCTAVVSLASDQAPPATAFGEIYISPNNDGVKDTLTVPFSISDKRYIAEWRLLITDENGNTVRKIVNKETRPVSLNFKEFWRIITRPKQSIPVPKSVVWDGAADSGEIAVDGRYFYSVQAMDDNGNISESEKRVVIVDCTPPLIEITQPSAQEKFFGEGAKSSIRIRQTGSREDTWTASIADTSDAVVRLWAFNDSEPRDTVWDGRDDSGVLVPDGVYSYTIRSADRAGNVSPPARVSNIVYSGDKPVTSIAIRGSRYFSPPRSLSETAAQGETDTRIKTITMIPSIPTPGSGNSLQSWRVEVINSAMQVKKTYSGGASVPESMVFDGFDDSGLAFDDGVYRARLTASYLNGYVTPEKLSPDFVLDRMKPQASIRLTDNIFSPNGDGDKDAIVFRQTLSQENTSWRGEIVNEQGGVVRGFDLGDRPAAEIAWNGLSDSGILCPDGDYTYRVLCTDLAGNSDRTVSLPFSLDNSATELIMSAAPEAFSPNGDGVQDSVRFSAASKSESGVVRYSLVVTDAAGKPVRTFAGNGSPPQSIVWDGKTEDGAIAPEGPYRAKLSATARNGSVSNVSAGPIVLDTTPPKALLNAPYLLFDPEPDSTRKVIPLVIETDPEKLWTGAVIPQGGAVPVRGFVWYDGVVPSFDWNGTDDSGNVVKDGTYRFTLSAQDPAGNRTTVELAGITVDTRPARAWITTEHETIAPNGSRTKSQVFDITVTPGDGLSRWTFRLVNAETPDGEPVKIWQGTGDTVPSKIEWDGRYPDSSVADGVFIGMLEAAYTRGKAVRTECPVFVCSAQTPVISVSTRPEFFSPDNDGVDDEEFITLNAFSYLPFDSWTFEVFDPQGRQSFWTASGKSQIARELVWDGRSRTGELVQSAMDYPYTFTVTDVEAQTSKVSGILRVDVLVVRDGDKLKMQVPAIIFRADHADFVSKAQDRQQGLEQSVIDNNMRVLRRIAQILNKFKDYTVVIEGHAHNVSGTESEETSVEGGNIPLVPLSNDRAAFVKQQLVRLGVSSGRMTTEGAGGRKPVANPANRDDWWKDRRVEFILNK